jgi:hypothetical protein
MALEIMFLEVIMKMLLATGGGGLNPGPTARPAETDNAQISAYVMYLGMQGKVIQRISGGKDKTMEMKIKGERLQYYVLKQQTDGEVLDDTLIQQAVRKSGPQIMSFRRCSRKEYISI